MNTLTEINREFKRVSAIIIALCGLSLLGAIAAIVVATITYQKFQSPVQLSTSQVIPTSTNAVYIASAMTPITLTLPNDLVPYVGKVYRIWSLTAEPHVVTFAPGPTIRSFTGGTTIATFGGAVGDGFVFEVISANTVVIVSSTNVNFT